MENRNRTFHEMNLFQGNWGNNSVDRRGLQNELEMEKVFEEIDKNLAENFNENRTRPNAKSPGIPLIFAPPVITSVEEKSFSSRRQITIDEETEEPSDSMEIFDDEADYSKEEIHGDFDESSDEKMHEESSGLQYEEESANQLSAIDEYHDEPHFYENHEESVDYQYDSPSEPMKLGTAAYSGKNNKIEMTKVRLPLHLADVDLEIDIFDTFSLSRQISSVSNVECSLQSIDAEVLLPSANLFTKGILLINIDYVSADNTGTMHSLKIHIPWKKIIPVHWFHQPELSFKDSKEYLFTSNLGREEGYTREYSESLVEKVSYSLSSLHCVWNEQFIQNDRVLIQGTARMKIDLYQKQCMDLEKLLSL
jgi:hypothetical protein